ncbi:sulfurtransferase [Chromatium okenii]|uniref:rhodanese-like domain-containing protein n=1 Tax=Chromatium okenii TaxID=61644 RepID=UPI0019077507|nr:rhodanese-like domain-containing protein [Chromatium okenii]MBK1641426.1 sulfurtransferase [Chromatium okenii]
MQQRFSLLSSCAAFLLGAFVIIGSAQAANATLTPPEVLSKLQAGELTLIDIRTPEEWRGSGVVAEAKRIDLQDPDGATGFTTKVLAAVNGDKTAPVAVICRTGSRSGYAQRFLQKQGFTNVINIPEGMIGSMAGPGWIERGLPIKPCPDC